MDPALLVRPGSERRIYELLLRRNFDAFAEKVFHTLNPGEVFLPNWHIDLICDRLERVRRGEIRRLIINLPPRGLKSMLVSVALPAFLLGHRPDMRIIAASYGADLAAKFGADTRSVMQSPWYRALFPSTRLINAIPAAGDFSTTRQGSRLAVSAGGPITGRGAGLIIIDDPLKASDAASDIERSRINDWFDQNVVQRLDDKQTGAIILVMQRLHDEDLTGYLLEKGGWEHLRLPAIAEEDEQFQLTNGNTIDRRAGEALHPARETLETLDALKRSIGAYDFAGQYQQDPAPREGGLVHAGHFPRQSSDNVRFDMVVQSWDTAHKTGELNDYSVCTTWGRTPEQLYYMLDLFRAKLAFPQLVARVQALHDQHRPQNILVEDSASGTSLIQSLRQQSNLPIQAIRPEGDKVTRLNLLTGLIESGHVILPPEAPWLDDFLLEITRFPRAKYDDQVDSFSQALSWMRQATRHQFW
jgi:predicted phage terminase large subunit-like protein